VSALLGALFTLLRAMFALHGALPFQLALFRALPLLPALATVPTLPLGTNRFEGGLVHRLRP